MRDGRDVGSTSKWGTAEPAGATHTAAIDADQIEGVLKVERTSGEHLDRVDGRSAGTTGIHEQDDQRENGERHTPKSKRRMHASALVAHQSVGRERQRSQVVHHVGVDA